MAGSLEQTNAVSIATTTRHYYSPLLSPLELHTTWKEACRTQVLKALAYTLAETATTLPLPLQHRHSGDVTARNIVVVVGPLLDPHRATSAGSAEDWATTQARSWRRQEGARRRTIGQRTRARWPGLPNRCALTRRVCRPHAWGNAKATRGTLGCLISAHRGIWVGRTRVVRGGDGSAQARCPRDGQPRSPSGQP